MKNNLIPILLGILVLAVIGYFVFSGGLGLVAGGSPSVKEIVANNMGYMCEWSGKIESLVNLDVWGKYYFHGKKLRFEEKTTLGEIIYVDPDITNPDGVAYQWTVLSFGGEPENVITLEKNKKEFLGNLEDVLGVIYKRQDEALDKVLREMLQKAAEKASSTGLAKLTIKKLECKPWKPDDSLFQPPSAKS